MKLSYRLLIVLMFLSVNFAFAQQTELEKGIELYKQGKSREAITVLEKLSKRKETKTDAKIWNYLGLAYIETGDLKKARKVLEQAVGLSPQNSAMRTNLGYSYLLSNKINNAQTELNQAIQIEPQNYTAYFFRGTSYYWERKLDEALADADKTIALNANFSSAYTLKSNILVSKFGNWLANKSTPKEYVNFLRQSIEVLEYCLKNCQNNSEIQQQQEKLEASQAFYKYFNREKTEDTNLTLTIDSNTSLTADNTITPLKILSKPAPRYTDRAREANISGTISLHILFAANGKVSHIIVLKGLGYGLDAEAVRAAGQIKFEPMMKDGKLVPVVKMVQYSFTIY